MRLFRWFLRRSQDERPLGTCAHCGLALELCPACEGAWRGSACTCGLGLRCATHGRHWS